MNMPSSPYLQKSGDSPILLENRMAIFGSDESNPICLHGGKIQGKHGYILFREGSFWIRALHVDFPIYINGVPTALETRLRDGDQIGIGSVVLQFVAPGQSHVENKDTEQPHQVIFDAMTMILESNDFTDAAQKLVQGVARILCCDGVALVRESEERGIQVLAGFPLAAAPKRFSHFAIEQARALGRTLLLFPTDLGQDSSQSIAENHISSVLCAPLMEQGEPLGFLYLDRIAGLHPFTDSDRNSFESLRYLFALILSKTARMERQALQVQALQQQDSRRSGIMGQSPAMLQALDQARAVAQTHASVFVHGETGTGKELFAQYIHQNSMVSEGPFIPINCGAIAANLIESELFGHEKGSFTGASETRTGWMEQANGGTLFLDEIGELDMSLQTRLLRVLQEGEVVRVGGRESRKVNFRLVSASHRDLRELVKHGRFREDLFYRIHVIGIELPPLRERGNDLLMLANYFLQRQVAQQGITGLVLGRMAEKAILAHAWPGNVRELQNAMQRAAVLCKTKTVAPDDLGLVARADDIVIEEGAFPTLQEAREDAERKCSENALKRTRGNVSLAARILDIDRKALIRILERIGIDPAHYK